MRLAAAFFVLIFPASPSLAAIHDPSSIVRCGKEAWYFSTGTGIKSHHTPDLLTWTEGPPVFKSIPAWHSEFVPENRGHLWAPDVIERSGRYWLYYSVSSFGKNTSAIGLVSAVTLDPADPRFGWKDEGMVIRSTPADPFNAIDPSVLATRDGKLWMVFGSFWSGIYEVELDGGTGLLKKNAKPEKVAWNEDIEAPTLIYYDNHYYLFVNWGYCCRGAKSTYEIRVGRSSKASGPFRDKDGNDLTKGGGTLFLKSEGRFIGPGHFANAVSPNNTRFAFHYYDGEANGVSKLGIRELTWSKDGWPQAGKWIFPTPAN